MTLFSYKVYQWELCGTPHCSQVAWVNTTVQIPNTPALFIRSQKNSMFPLSSISCVSYVTPTHQNRALTVLEGLSSMFILGQADIKQLLNGTAVRASCTLVFLIWGPAKSNHYQSMSRLESNQSVSPSGGKTQGSFQMSVMKHILSETRVALWSQHPSGKTINRTVSLETLPNPKHCYATSASIIPSPQKPDVCKDCKAFLINKS